MDYHQLLHILTTNADENANNFDEKLEKILNKVCLLLPLPEKLNENINSKCDQVQDNCSMRRKYLETILHVLTTLQEDVLSKSDTFMSVTEYRGVKVAIELVISIGIIPCLLPGIGAGLSKLCRHATHLTEELIPDLEKYDRLATTTRVLASCFNEISLRPAILTQLGPFLGALLQLAYAPLMKPTDSTVIQSSQFQMTQKLYEKLLKDQEEFTKTLGDMVKNCPQSPVMKELMVLSGLKDAPNWLKRRTRAYLVQAIVVPTGIMALIHATCEDTLDLGMHWNKLDTISKLIATSHEKDSEQYYNAVCTQLIDILISKTSKNATTIANSCITALYEANPAVCVKKIVCVIAAPLMIKYSSGNRETTVLKSETQVSECIDNLAKCFVPKDANFKYLPCVLMKEIAIPLFCIHTMVYQSASLLRSKVRELLTHLLTDESLRDNLFATFLQHDSKHCVYFGETLSFQFGPSGGLEIINKSEEFKSDGYSGKLADSLFDLIRQDEGLSLSLLNYLLQWLTVLNDIKSQLKENHRLETEEDFIDSVYKQLTAKKLLLSLTSTSTIQKGLMKSPQSLLSFIRSLFATEFTKDDSDNGHLEILYASLMLVKVILFEGGKPNDWTPFNNFASFLKEKINVVKPPLPLLNLIREVLDAIRMKGRTRHFQDLSTDKNEGRFENALRDLADPLLPIRTHGLMTLTKLIEMSDPETIAKKDLVLCFFQENLKDDDSFVYLTAINGLCTMALSFPQQVIEILVQEFIDMPQRSVNGEIDPENRAKLGEILVKTTRALGDMASAYKNILINGFLCAIRDPDSMVRSSSLSCLGELCKVLGFRLGNAITEVLYCLGCIIDTDKAEECRRAAVLVTTLLIQGLGKDVLVDLGSDLLPIYRRLKHLRDNDNDHVLRLHAQLALEELDDIVQNFLFAKPVLRKNIFLIS